jgi:hypothetical protein
MMGSNAGRLKKVLKRVWLTLLSLLVILWPLCLLATFRFIWAVQEDKIYGVWFAVSFYGFLANLPITIIHLGIFPITAGILAYCKITKNAVNKMVLKLHLYYCAIFLAILVPYQFDFSRLCHDFLELLAIFLAAARGNNI